MSEKHVYVCDNCGKEAGDIKEVPIRTPMDVLPDGWFVVAGKSDIHRPAHFCSNGCVAAHFSTRTVANV